MLDLVWSTIFYGSVLAVMAGVWAVVRPLCRLGLTTRARAFGVFLTAVLAIGAVTMVLPPTTTMAPAAPAASAIDTFAPQFQIRDRHEIRIAAPADRVYAAIRAVTANEIALFQTLTAIRRFGQPGPASILNAPEHQPILEVAMNGGFVLLSEAAPREVVVGALVIAPSGPRAEGKLTADTYRSLSRPGFAKATMNFRVEPDGTTGSRVVTETRVFATDRATLRRFTAYWRVIYPGSGLMRLTWLRAIKARAEK